LQQWHKNVVDDYKWSTNDVTTLQGKRQRFCDNSKQFLPEWIRVKIYSK